MNNNNNNNVFYAVYELLKNDEIIKGVFDYPAEVIEYLNNKINMRHLSTYIKNNYIIVVNNKSYKVYKFKDED